MPGLDRQKRKREIVRRSKREKSDNGEHSFSHPRVLISSNSF